MQWFGSNSQIWKCDTSYHILSLAYLFIHKMSNELSRVQTKMYIFQHIKLPNSIFSLISTELLQKSKLCKQRKKTSHLVVDESPKSKIAKLIYNKVRRNQFQMIFILVINCK